MLYDPKNIRTEHLREGSSSYVVVTDTASGLKGESTGKGLGYHQAKGMALRDLSKKLEEWNPVHE